MADAYERDRAHTCVVLCQTAINLMEQIGTEAGGVMEKANAHRDHRAMLKTLERMQQKFLRVYEIARSTDRTIP